MQSVQNASASLLVSSCLRSSWLFQQPPQSIISCPSCICFVRILSLVLYIMSRLVWNPNSYQQTQNFQVSSPLDSIYKNQISKTMFFNSKQFGPGSRSGLGVNMALTCRICRLAETCVRCIAQHLLVLVREPLFNQLVKESAESVQNREDVDSVPIIDDIRYHVTLLHGDGELSGQPHSNCPFCCSDCHNLCLSTQQHMLSMAFCMWCFAWAMQGE